MQLRHPARLRVPGLVLLALAGGLNVASAQSDSDQIAVLLGDELLPPQVAAFEVKDYVVRHVAALPKHSTAEEWTAASKRLRAHLLNDITFHGWPDAWANSPVKFEDLGVFAAEPGYRLRKLRIEILPGFQMAAILYEPKEMQGRIPAILCVNGHSPAEGKSLEFKQKLCITFAKHGIMALNLEWLGMGELKQPGNHHSFGAHLDLVGLHEMGLFMLAMRRGLDYLYNHPQVDRRRLGVTGLSGGGWQTIVLSALDDRVTAAVPVAGFSSIVPDIEVHRYGDLGDTEQNPTDAFEGADYPELVAMFAPRPMLLINNAEDDCCFRAPAVKPLNYDAIKPIFRLFGREDALSWHENADPGTHNYQLDNRTAAYGFFSRAFDLPAFGEDPAIAHELKSYDELLVGLPKDNLTILGLAKKVAAGFHRDSIPSDAQAQAAWASGERAKLRRVVRMEPAKMVSPWVVETSKNKGIESFSYLFRMENGLSASGVWTQAIQRAPNSPPTIVLDDGGKRQAAEAVSDRVNRGEAVLALDLVFMGDAWPSAATTRGVSFYDQVSPASYMEMFYTLGTRPLGLEAAQLIEVARWMAGRQGAAKVRLECTGIRNQAVALVAAALEPQLFSEVVIHRGIRSFGYLLEKPVRYGDAPELFCLDFYRDFDLDRLGVLAAPTKVRTERTVDGAGRP